ncbi:low molecular weight protein-tyrosine-phosphatase [Pigmentiphaga litoralis]|uniref:protein-tyrosine-phosphatase n=1 Tax=Pigmentiphaga litoralis TaxID=516702 RepID=A0A7Y9LL50_9BURK|nr:low molecular weight protein-tyrosine-phosphatase [Pigmentiphaga litoralis]NYE24199.1 protein-tyrosine phosphatase [Pigmentiphaga litoralis]NYE82187.1 protein-tyrosine phosphatase [Pigmentiphaga litoralis]
MNAILTICVGNICRSPMAAALLARDLPQTRVSSAGVGALIGSHADSKAIALMAKRNLDISGHIARQVGRELCQQADLILVMDQAQRRFLELHYPFVTGKVFRLCEAIRQDVPDPYRLSTAAFEYSLSLIEAGVKTWAGRIAKL